MLTLKTINGRLEIDGRPVLKGWESWTGWFWFGIQEVEPGYWFGLVQGQEVEYGYFEEGELKLIGKYNIWPIKPQDLPIAGRRGE
jgi:hypothetical protein